MTTSTSNSEQRYLVAPSIVNETYKQGGDNLAVGAVAVSHQGNTETYVGLASTSRDLIALAILKVLEAVNEDEHLDYTFLVKDQGFLDQMKNVVPNRIDEVVSEGAASPKKTKKALVGGSLYSNLLQQQETLKVGGVSISWALAAGEERESLDAAGFVAKNAAGSIETEKWKRWPRKIGLHS